ncbi:MAG: 50S ribosomal protein L11 methyltransferase [Trueperaceae bacterium]|nr:MAG: 50S ribosomal protein L11 methyltransferase [Trueperaceae bacterium]
MAELIYAFRFPGLLEDDSPEAALLWAYGCSGLLQDGDEIVAYFSERRELPISGKWQVVAEEGYLETYYAELRPVTIGRLVVAPTHCQVRISAGQKVLWVDPGMAFGTGHHETTRLALRALESVPLMGRTVLDVGAGSGILAVAADLLGAGEAVGVDIDPDTVPIAVDNALANCSRARFEFGTIDHKHPASSVDIVVANLYAELHVLLADTYHHLLRPGGILLATGILRDKISMVREALGSNFSLRRSLCEGDWVLVQAEKETLF